MKVGGVIRIRYAEINLGNWHLYFPYGAILWHCKGSCRTSEVTPEAPRHDLTMSCILSQSYIQYAVQEANYESSVCLRTVIEL